MKAIWYPDVLRSAIVLAILIAAHHVIAQTTPHAEQEKNPDPYVHVDPLSYPTSPAPYKLPSGPIVIVPPSRVFSN